MITVDFNLWGPMPVDVTGEVERAAIEFKSLYAMLGQPPCECGVAHAYTLIAEEKAGSWRVFNRVELPPGHHSMMLREVTVESPPASADVGPWLDIHGEPACCKEAAEHLYLRHTEACRIRVAMGGHRAADDDIGQGEGCEGGKCVVERKP